jgi:acetolactate synthase-1/2/3 large subunit
VLGGRAPALRWGQGSLQEIDHVPFVAPLTRFAATAPSADAVGGLIDDALRAASAPRRVSRSSTSRWTTCSARPTTRGAGRAAPRPRPVTPDGDALRQRPALLAERQRPVIMAGTNVWWGHARDGTAGAGRALRIPVLMNGMARGTVPADTTWPSPGRGQRR